MSDDIDKNTIEVIAKYSGLKVEEITRETQLDEIGVNSLELVDVVMDVEEMYDIEVDLNAAEATDALKSVGDILDAIRALVAAKG